MMLEFFLISARHLELNSQSPARFGAQANPGKIKWQRKSKTGARSSNFPAPNRDNVG